MHHEQGTGDNIELKEAFKAHKMYKKLLFAMIGLALLTVLFAACSIKDAANLATGPKVKMGPSTFIDTTVTVPKGQSMTLVNTASDQHIIVNGEWQGAKQNPMTEPGAPKINDTIGGNGSTAVGPFTTAGTFKYYCTIHGGMNLTVTVK